MQIELSPAELRAIMRWHDCAKKLDMVFTDCIKLDRKIESAFESAVNSGEDDFYKMDDSRDN